jgi:uncharacterized protein
MITRKFRFLTAGFLICLMAATNHAQEPINTSNIKAEKRDLILQIIKLTDVVRLSESSMNAMLDQIEKNMPQALKALIPEGLSKEEQEAFEQRTQEGAARFSRRYRAELPIRINLSETVEQIQLMLYDKYFTEEDLKALIVFYQSPAGSKFIRVTPQIARESVELSSQLLNPKIFALVTEILEDEKKRLKEATDKLSNEPPSPPPPPANKRKPVRKKP